MSKPNMYCGECPYWLAYGELETTDEQKLAIEEHCAKCELDFDPEAADYLDRMMRAARQQIVLCKAIHEDDYRGTRRNLPVLDEACDLSDEEYEAAAEDAYNNLVRSLVEASGEIRELNDEKNRLIFALKEAVEWLDYFLTTERDDIYYDDANEVRCRAEYLLMELEG